MFRERCYLREDDDIEGNLIWRIVGLIVELPVRLIDNCVISLCVLKFLILGIETL